MQEWSKNVQNLFRNNSTPLCKWEVLELGEAFQLRFEIPDRSLMVYGLQDRDLPRFFDQVGHQTTNASIGNMHFFTK